MTTDELPEKIIIADTNNNGYYKPSVDARETAIAERLKKIEGELLYHADDSPAGDGIKMLRDLHKELTREK